MSISVTLDGELVAEIATNSGWGGFCRWARDLDVKRCPTLLHLVAHGWTEDTDDLEDELWDVLTNSPPSDEDVGSVGENLLDILQDKDYGQTALTVTDGLKPASVIP